MKRLSLREAYRNRDAAIEAVDHDGNMSFKLAAIDALRRVAKKKRTFIVDDVWEELQECPEVSDNRAMGAVTMFAIKEGWIKPTTSFVPSAQPQCHANPRRVWESTIDS